jgi:hypothetical protein
MKLLYWPTVYGFISTFVFIFPPFVYNCCIMDRTYHSHKYCHSALAPLCHHSSGTLSFFKRLPSPPKLHGMPPLGLIVQQTLMLLPGNIWANLTEL